MLRVQVGVSETASFSISEKFGPVPKLVLSPVALAVVKQATGASGSVHDWVRATKSD